MGTKQLTSRLPFLFGASGVLAAIFANGCGGGGGAITGTIDKVSLGKALFTSKEMSSPSGQACVSCHVESQDFTDPRQDASTSEGVTPGIFGNRQTPTISYMKFSPAFGFDNDAQDYLGGNFWDGRAADLKDQAHFPLLNPAEMNNASRVSLASKIRHSQLSASFVQIYGTHVFDTDDSTIAAMADAIASFESSPPVNPFSSKYDAYLKGQVQLTAAETRGLNLFNGKAGCFGCHPSAPGPNGEAPLFTDFSYDNIGLPKNPNSKFYNDPISINPDGPAFMDKGLMNTTGRPEDVGRFKVPTLRNVAITAPYFHSGVIKTLNEAVQFYNKRDLGGFGVAEFPGNQNNDELGNLGLTDDEVADVVTFLGTLTDGFTVANRVVKP